MSKKRNEPKARKKATFQGFINADPTENARLWVEANEEVKQPAGELLMDFAAYGLKISISWDEPRSCHVVSAYQQWADMPKAGWILTSRHYSVWRAMMVMCFYIEQAWPDLNWMTREDQVNW